jgi:hypothetical protein
LTAPPERRDSGTELIQIKSCAKYLGNLVSLYDHFEATGIMRGRRARSAAEQRSISVARRFEETVEHTEGFGLILLSWALQFTSLGGIILLFIGLSLWNWWVFLAGLVSLRLFGYLRKCSQRQINRYFS